MDSFEPWTPVDVCVVVEPRAEGRELPARPFDSPGDELVERLGPRGGVECRAPEQHAVGVEDARANAGWQAEQLPRIRRRQRDLEGGDTTVLVSREVAE